jgi:hypothetical protein
MKLTNKQVRKESAKPAVRVGEGLKDSETRYWRLFETAQSERAGSAQTYARRPAHKIDPGRDPDLLQPRRGSDPCLHPCAS